MTTTAGYQIAVNILTDTTSLKTGTAEAATAIDSLANSVDTSSTQMVTSLDKIGTGVHETLGSGGVVDQAAVGLTTKASKFKAVGSEIGLNLAQGIGGGVGSPDAAANLLSSVGGLVSPLAATGAGAIAAIGIGIGGSLIASVIKGVNASKTEFAKSVNDLVSAAGSDFTKSMKDLTSSITDAVSPLAVLTKLGGDAGVYSGLDKAQQYADQLGISLTDVVAALEGKATPAFLAVEASAKATHEQFEKQNGLMGTLTQQQVGLLKPAQDLQDLYDKQHQATQRAITDTQTLKGLTTDITTGTQLSADAIERYANAVERAVRSASRFIGLANGVGGF